VYRRKMAYSGGGDTMIDLAELKRLEQARTHHHELISCAYHQVVHVGGCAGPQATWTDSEYVAAIANAGPDILALLEEAREIVDYLADYVTEYGLAYAPADAFLAKFGEGKQ